MWNTIDFWMYHHLGVMHPPIILMWLSIIHVPAVWIALIYLWRRR